MARALSPTPPPKGEGQLTFAGNNKEIYLQEITKKCSRKKDGRGHGDLGSWRGN